jgi:tellurium resistance protein TerD
MAINLKKGQSINLEKDANDLSQIIIGLGWKIRKKGFFAGLMGGGKDEEHDLDAIAFLLDANGKVTNLGGQQLVGSDVVYFNNLRHPSGEIYHSGDNRVGGSGASDDEQIVVRLNTLPARIERILFLVQIYQGVKKKQNFGQVDSAYIRAVDAKGVEMARYNLDSDPLYDGKCIMVFGDVARQGSSWKFRALGEGYPTDNFVEILKTHL